MLKNSFLLAATLFLTLSTEAQADTIAADGLWYQFDVDKLMSNSGNLEWIDLEGNALGFDFSLTESAYLTVVDGGFAGDRFNVFDNGILLGQTSVAVNSYPVSVSVNFDQAIANTDYSRAVFLLAPGNHSLSGSLSLSALDDQQFELNATVGAVSLAAVPLPAAVWLFGSSCAVMGMLSRRRLNKHQE